MKSLYLSFVGLVAMMAGMMALAIIAMFGALPIHYLMKMILAVCAVLALLKGKPWGLWIIVGTVIIFMYIIYDRYKEKMIKISSQALRGLVDTELV